MMLDCMEEEHINELYDETFKSAFAGKIPSKVHHIPSFGGVISPSDHYLSDDAHDILRSIRKVFRYTIVLIFKNIY